MAFLPTSPNCVFPFSVDPAVVDYSFTADTPMPERDPLVMELGLWTLLIDSFLKFKQFQGNVCRMMLSYSVGKSVFDKMFPTNFSISDLRFGYDDEDTKTEDDTCVETVVQGAWMLKQMNIALIKYWNLDEDNDTRRRIKDNAREILQKMFPKTKYPSD